MNSVLRKIGFFTAFILPFLTIAGFYAGGWWNYVSLIFVFGMLPFIDQSVGIDTTNVTDNTRQQTENDLYYRFITYLWTYVQLLFILWAAWVVSKHEGLTAVEWTGLILSSGLVTGGIGITVAHELGHKKSKLERFYAGTLLMTVCYMHFLVEHNRGHHRHVGTSLDPATARKDQNFYRFWFQSVLHGYAHAWKLEGERLSKKGLPSLHPQNVMIAYTMLPIIFCIVLMLIFNLNSTTPPWTVPLLFFAQSFVAFTLLELVNYVEHYGIVRREISPGKFEPVNTLHSWNASHLISNFFLFQLQRHSDHHVYALKRYQVLDHHDESPQLPFGYSTMIMMALVPPLWFSRMNKRLENWRQLSESAPVYPAAGVAPH